MSDGCCVFVFREAIFHRYHSCPRRLAVGDLSYSMNVGWASNSNCLPQKNDDTPLLTKSKLQNMDRLVPVSGVPHKCTRGGVGSVRRLADCLLQQPLHVTLPCAPPFQAARFGQGCREQHKYNPVHLFRFSNKKALVYRRAT